MFSAAVVICALRVNEKFHVLLNVFLLHVQSTLIISTSIISNNRLSPRENLVSLLT